MHAAMSRASAVGQTCRCGGGRRPRTRHLWAARIECVLLAGLLLHGAACRRPPSPVQASRSREVMGTLATLTAVARDEATATAAVEAGYARLEDVNRLMSDYVADSEIGRLNRLPAGTPVPVAAETWACIRRALEVWRASGGAFDVTCRPLVSLWKQAGAQGRLPTAEQIAAVRALIGCDRIVMDEKLRTVALPAAGMQIDLGGIAKGQALDLAAAAMRDRGAKGALVDVGGDVVAVGTRPDGQPWRVGVQDPSGGASCSCCVCRIERSRHRAYSSGSTRSAGGATRTSSTHGPAGLRRRRRVSRSSPPMGSRRMPGRRHSAS